MSQSHGPQFERIIDEKYLDVPGDNVYRLETYRSKGYVSSSSAVQLRCYFLHKCEFVNPHPEAGETRIEVLSDRRFLERATKSTKEVYQRVIESVLSRTGPVLELLDYESSHEKRLVIGYKRGSTQNYFSSLSDLYHYYDLYSTRKYVEHFSNGVTIVSLYLKAAGNYDAPPMEDSILQVVKEASLLYCLPRTPFSSLFEGGKLSVQETVYGYVAWIFCQHFMNRLGAEYGVLSSLLNPADAAHGAVLNKIKKRLREDTFTPDSLLSTLMKYPVLIKLLYVNFAMTHYVNTPRPGKAALRPSLSYQRIKTDEVLTDDDIVGRIRQTVENEHEHEIFRAILVFNQHILKTNFYQPTKVALSFRLDPAFLPTLEYPQKLYGMFFIVGSEFRGFHLRFRDVARGGIRIVRSANREVWASNARTLFDENYNLANTQERKNKDIPEGGAKGTVLLNPNAQTRMFAAFEKYVDSMIDLVVVGTTPGVKEKIVDLHGKPELLFFGPDEGSADFMNWASHHARKRGVQQWKGFTTGKSPEFGGIPHDLYGMTTRSVHQYVLGICRKLNIKEEELTKLQTGGPDGDLGSNEIKISKDRTIAIVDGSGVLCDPNGIDRTELLRLATARKMISNFDVSKLSKDGFRVLVDQQKAVLPDGTVIERCMDFRNTFHLSPYAAARIFVPCGGRPEAVGIDNVDKIFNADGRCRFQFVVEGANLFFTQPARLHLEKKGVILFKDASTNKGGVTSSSLEVLAALALSDEEFKDNMTVQNGVIPEFYASYVKDVQRIIEENAFLEFECLWKESERTKTPRSILSDILSNAILKMCDEMEASGFWENLDLRRAVLARAAPPTLLRKVGYEGLVARVPEPYLRAIFLSFLCSRFVYSYGTEPSQFAFFEYMSKFAAATQQA